MPGVDHPLDLASLTRALAAAGCVAAAEEAEELIRSAAGAPELERMLARRVTGEPLAWITGSAGFCDVAVTVEPGVYVPRWQSEPLARLAADLLPATGVGVDLGTGSGAIALVMQSARPGARVVATEIDPVAADCARRNGVMVYSGHLDEPLPPELASRVDVMTGVLPYVPNDALQFLPRDVLRFEPRVALDGGRDGLQYLSTAVANSARWIKAGGWLLLEVGGDQITALAAMFAAAGYRAIEVLRDDDGDPRGIYGRRGTGAGVVELAQTLERTWGPP